MAKWNILNRINEIKTALDTLYVKKTQRDDLSCIIDELHDIQRGIEDHMKDKTEFNRWCEKHITAEINPNSKHF